jgi:cytochrome c peroxidase
MGDGLAVSIGVGGGLLIGPGRAGPSVLTRNAPTLWNVAFRRSLFWDGRSDSLEAQVLLPLASPIELDRDPAALMEDIAAIPEYATRFARAFPNVAGDAGDAVTLAHLQAAIAAFERTLVSDQSLYEAWLAGDGRALTPEVLAGMQVFADAGCPSCHIPPTFDSERFAARNVGAAGSDRGRAAISEAAEDERAFKVPSLRNLRNTGPYFHDGSVADLGAAIDHELAESGAVVTFDERNALVAFLTQALVDRSRGPAIPVAVPSGLPVPEDGFRVLR